MAPPKRPPKNLGELTPTSFRDHVRFSGGDTVLGHFKKIDLDGSGEVDKKEWAKGVVAMGFLDATQEEADAVFDWLDSDGSGSIPYKELDLRLRRSEPPVTDLEKRRRLAKEGVKEAEEIILRGLMAEAIEAAARAMIAEENKRKAAEKAAARKAAKSSRAPPSPAPSPAPTTTRSKPKSHRYREPAEKPKKVGEGKTFRGFQGSEGYLKPTLGAPGLALIDGKAVPIGYHKLLEGEDTTSPPAAAPAPTSARPKKSVKPLVGQPNFLKPIGEPRRAWQQEHAPVPAEEDYSKYLDSSFYSSETYRKGFTSTSAGEATAPATKQTVFASEGTITDGDELQESRPTGDIYSPFATGRFATGRSGNSPFATGRSPVASAKGLRHRAMSARAPAGAPSPSSRRSTAQYDYYARYSARYSQRSQRQSMRSARGEEQEKAAMEETRRQEKEKRDKVRLAALRAAERAKANPMPTSHPPPANWAKVPDWVLEKWAKDRAARDAMEKEWEKRRWTEFAKYKQASEVMGSPGVVEHGRGEEGALWQVIEAW